MGLMRSALLFAAAFATGAALLLVLAHWRPVPQIAGCHGCALHYPFPRRDRGPRPEPAKPYRLDADFDRA